MCVIVCGCAKVSIPIMLKQQFVVLAPQKAASEGCATHMNRCHQRITAHGRHHRPAVSVPATPGRTCTRPRACRQQRTNGLCACDLPLQTKSVTQLGAFWGGRRPSDIQTDCTKALQYDSC